MSIPFLVRGDVLPELGPIPHSSDTKRFCGLFWGLDLRHRHTRKQARSAWRAAVDGVKAELDAHPELQRICMACSRPQRFPQNARIRMPAGLAPRLYTDLERDRGRYVSVLVLDVTGCDDPALLRSRLCEALTHSTGWADLTLNWDGLVDTSVADIWISTSL